MAIERMDMAGGGEGGGTPEAPVATGEIKPAVSGNIPSEPKFQIEGSFVNVVDPATNAVIERMPQVAGGAPDRVLPPSDSEEPDPDVLALVEELELGAGNEGLSRDSSSSRRRRRVDGPFDRRNYSRRRREDPDRGSGQPRRQEASNGGGGNGGRDGLPPPENGRDRGPEWETSPERGRWLVEEIVKLETRLHDPNLSSQERTRLTIENAPRLDRLYNGFLKHVEKLQETRNDLAPYNPISDHAIEGTSNRTGVGDAMIQAYRGRVSRAVARGEQQAQAAPEDLTGVESLDDLTKKWEDTTTPAAERGAIEGNLLKYFREAHRKGLLKGVDEIFNSLWLASQNERARPRIGELLLQKLVQSNQNSHPEAVVLAQTAFLGRASDPEVARLANVWEPYIRWNLSKFTNLLNGSQADHREGEWRLPETPDAEEVTETFWEPYQGYPDYYTVTARTPAEFVIAKETFLRMLKNHALGYDPNELMTNLVNFKKVFARNALDLAIEQEFAPDSPSKMTIEFAEQLRQEFEGEGYTWGGAYHGEVYNKDGKKQYGTAMALHEGPQRWIALLRSNEGRVAAPTWILDNLYAVELAYNAQGSKGQLGRSSVAQNHFRNIIWDIIVDKNIGVVLKDYDWRDTHTYSNPEIRLNRARRLQKIEEHLKRNGYRLDTLEDDAQQDYLNARTHFRENQKHVVRHQSSEAFRSLYEGMELDENGLVKGDAHIRNFQMFGNIPTEVLSQLPRGLRESISAGKVQSAIEQLRQDVRFGRERLRGGQTLRDKLIELEAISKREDKIYQRYYDKARANFNIAMDMQMMQEEHTIRGGGVYFIYKNPYVREYHAVRGAEDSKLSPRERATNWTNEQYIGWILDEISKGRAEDSFTPHEQELLQPLSEQDKKSETDQIPIHLALKAVQAAANWTKIKYADDAQIWQREDLKKKIYEKNPDGHYENPNFRAKYRKAMTDHAIKLATEQVWGDGFQAVFYDIDYEADGVTIRDRDEQENPVYRPMMFKVPQGEIDPQTGKMNVQRIAEVPLDFDKAVNSYLALHTTHTYWAYQNNNTHTLTMEGVFKQAKDIREGKIRFEDADMLAGLLLTLDPTLSRVKGFNGERMAIESLIFDAAVEESFQTWIDAKNSLKEAFLPKDGNVEFMQAGYYTEDNGGDARFSTMVEALVAKMPKRWARRFSAALGITPMYATTMADSIGRKGVIGAVSMMADNIHEISGQRGLGQFGITKFINLIDRSSQLWFTLVGGVDPKTGLHHEGVFTKPTNNSDKLQKHFGKVEHARELPEHEDELLYDFRESFGRIEATLKTIRAMYSDDRNAGGALDLREMDVFLPDDRINPDITKESERNTGSSRHIAKMFWNAYVDWLLDEGPGGGAKAYPQEAGYYKFLKEPLMYDIKLGIKPPRTVADWLFDKMAL